MLSTPLKKLMRQVACCAVMAQGAGIDEPLAELRGASAAYHEQDGLGS